MRLTRTHAGAAAFVFAFALGAGAGALFQTPRAAAPPAARAVESRTAPVAPAVGVGVSFRTQLVTLDFSARELHTSLVLERDPARRAPESVWVKTFLFRDHAGRGARACPTEAVRLIRPFDEAGSARHVVVVPVNACQEPRDASVNFYARVLVSTTNPAEQPDRAADFDIRTATPVVVEWDAGGRR